MEESRSLSGPGTPAAPPTIPWWVSALLVLNALAVGAVSLFSSAMGAGGLHAGALIFAVVDGGPFLLLAILLRTRPRPLFFGALAVAQVFAVMAYLGMALLLSFAWSDTPSTNTSTVQLRFWVLLAAGAQLSAFIWAIRAIRWSRQEHPGSTEALIGGAAMFAWPIVAGAVAMAAGVQLEHAEFTNQRGIEQRLARNSFRIQRCALQYAEQHPDEGFPHALAEMGPRGTKCLERDDIAETHKGYTISYTTEPAYEYARAESFVVTGSAEPERNVGTLTVWGDTAGILERSYWLRPGEKLGARGDEIPIALQSIHDCVEAMRVDGGVPEDITQLLAAVRDVRNTVSYASRGCEGEVVRNAADSVDREWYAERSGYRLSYQRVEDSYRIEARPAAYGESALRSYLMDEAGAVHFTRADRAATDDDPELPACAPYDVGDCAPTPLSVEPHAQFIHPARITLDSVYWLHARASGDTARLPARLTWSFDCNARPADTSSWKPTPTIAAGIPDQSCPPLSYADPPVGDAIVVRLWLRNAAGLVTHLDETIRVDGDSGRELQHP